MTPAAIHSLGVLALVVLLVVYEAGAATKRRAVAGQRRFAKAVKTAREHQ